MAQETQWVPMGYIKGAFGIKGWVKVAADTEYADSLLDYPEWRLIKDGKTVSAVLEAGKVSGGDLQVKFQNTDDRNAAHLLRGYTVEINRSDFGETEEGEYYWADLVGMAVATPDGEILGTVSGLMETGAHDILVVKHKDGQTLIPFVEQFVGEINRDTRTITADWAADY
ncbi:Ribosome maturation factor rimM [Kingella potus]|uniref:Ribosome maturation factor RimM n=1 Tax=Kingella potus TaxID=265175 RepID=A0A377R2F7_9NEIS|nr:ribosome maturation factor RimM [Kingella potus]UOP01217.1 ribosome maturation factor RimM [Kingella potus]STR00938.1 Ribosome maturation factor rimM [Kingella potus]